MLVSTGTVISQLSGHSTRRVPMGDLAHYVRLGAGPAVTLPGAMPPLGAGSQDPAIAQLEAMLRMYGITTRSALTGMPALGSGLIADDLQTLLQMPNPDPTALQV